MDHEEKQREELPLGQNRPIQLVVSRNEAEGVTIDLGRVFHTMKVKGRIFAWVLVLCLTVGVCAPLLLYQFTKSPLKVSSVVTLRYEVPVKVEQTNEKGEKELVIPEDPEYEPVSDLTAPDGTELDVNQLTSTYVLQNALEGLTLSANISPAQLAGNIRIQTVLTEESRRTREALAGLAEAKNASAYERLQTAEMKYENRFIVSLTNGFGEEDSRNKVMLKDEELSLVLDRVLAAYNSYLVRTYADTRLPEDTFSVIDIAALDVLDSLDQIRTALSGLNTYITDKSETVQAYRSWQTGKTLTDWAETLATVQSVDLDYLQARVNAEAVTRNKTALLTGWKYQLRNSKNQLDEINENIAETRKILASYKNDEVYISMQESDAVKSTRAATDYYNELVLKQTENYEKVAELKATIADYEDRIARLETAKATEVSEEVEAELARTLDSATGLYTGIRDHMEEIFDSPLYTTYEDYSMPQGKTEGFLKASAKKMIIGGVIGVVLACGLWFLAGLAPEFSRGRKGKEAAAK